MGTLTRDELSTLLGRTSRTFALAIPLLEEPIATAVGLAYLLFRIADTLEDASLWGRDRRKLALASFAGWLGDSNESDWKHLVASNPPTSDAGCIELLARADDVLGSARAMGDETAQAVVRATHRTATGMAAFVARQDELGALVLGSVEDLRAYAYVVAGIVGELLTELFVIHVPLLVPFRARLEEQASAFGEGLQLVNILKDAPADGAEGRQYLPPGVPREAVVNLAREDLRRAALYVAALDEAKAPPGVVAFCELPLRLAVATLDRLDAGATKLGRDEVMEIFAGVTARARARAVA